MSNVINFGIVFFTLFMISVAYAQNTVKSSQAAHTYQITAKKISQKIQIDGELDEEIWQNTEKAKDFFQSFPYDSSFALSKTEAMIAYDADYIYIAAICNDSQEGKYVVQSLRRDFEGENNDFFAVYFDTFSDRTNGFAFGVSPYGVQREGLITDGGNDDLDVNWDNKWYANARMYQGYYTIEMAIPFKTLRFKEGSSAWQVNFGRIDRKRNEISSWVPVPRNFRLTNLANTGTLQWDEPLQKVGTNFSVIPYISTGTSKNHLENTSAKNTANIGADVKIGVTSSLNLDLTFNPDFSQVEVDRQVTNLARFELFFPERRQFFLENNDLFARFGFPDSRPFFSRRVGIARDTNTGLIALNPIIYGARLSGKLNKDWRVGLLNMQTARKPEAGIDGQNYAMAVLQRKMFTRSYISGVFINRQRTSDENRNFSWAIPDFDRITGLEYNLQSTDNRWTGEWYYHRLFNQNNQAKQGTHGSYLGYNTPKWEASFNHLYVGKNYSLNQIGFVPRNNYWNIGQSLTRKLFPQKKNATVNNHGPQLLNNLYWRAEEGDLTDRYTELGYTVNFNSGAFAGLWFYNQYTKLFFDFDPTNTDGRELLAGTAYTNSGYYIRYESNPRRRFVFSQGIGFGEYFNGDLWVFEGDINYRIQPIMIVSMSYTYNRIRLPQDYSDSDLLLIGPRLDFTFTKNVFFTLFTQYNNQINNINLNARLQWRFKPVSDAFLVYTDNYFSNNLKVKNRALVLKITYWLNL
jgi:hypothetical protein